MLNTSSTALRTQGSTLNKLDVRVRVLSIDGQELSPAAPSSVRKMLKTGVAVLTRTSDGDRILQMKRQVGNRIPHQA